MSNFIDLSKIPVGLTFTTRDCGIVMNALVGVINPEDQDRADLILRYVRSNSEMALRKHKAASVPTAPSVRHLHEVEAVMAPLRALPSFGDVA